jgi:hypothetical protein
VCRKCRGRASAGAPPGRVAPARLVPALRAGAFLHLNKQRNSEGRVGLWPRGALLCIAQ